MKLILTHKSAYEYWHLPPLNYQSARARRRLDPTNRVFQISGDLENPELSCDVLGDYAPKVSDVKDMLAARGPIPKLLRQLELPLHTSVAPGHCRRANQHLAFHLQKNPLPFGSLQAVDEELTVASPELVFLQMAPSLSFPELVRLGFEFCGTYCISADGHLHHRARICSAQQLANLAASAGVRGAQAARIAAKYVIDGSDSPRESALAMLLCLPLSRGGYNLPRPQLNLSIRLSKRAADLLGESEIAPDLIWRTQRARIAVEYQGAQHNGYRQRQSDALRRAALQQDGWELISIDADTLASPERMDAIVGDICHKLRIRKPKSSPASRAARAELCAALGISNSPAACPSVKSAIRQRLIQRRDSMDPQQLHSADQALLSKVCALPSWKQAGSIFSYVSVGAEVDTSALIQEAWRSGKTVLIPRCLPDRRMEWTRLDSFAQLRQSPRGLMEDPVSAPICPNELPGPALALVPALAFDAQGQRIGYGGGYYDAFLAQFDGYSVGLARKDFVYHQLPCSEAHDRPVDCVLWG